MSRPLIFLPSLLVKKSSLVQKILIFRLLFSFSSEGGGGEFSVVSNIFPKPPKSKKKNRGNKFVGVTANACTDLWPMHVIGSQSVLSLKPSHDFNTKRKKIGLIKASMTNICYSVNCFRFRFGGCKFATWSPNRGAPCRAFNNYFGGPSLLAIKRLLAAKRLLADRPPPTPPPLSIESGPERPKFVNNNIRGRQKRRPSGERLNSMSGAKQWEIRRQSNGREVPQCMAHLLLLFSCQEEFYGLQVHIVRCNKEVTSRCTLSCEGFCAVLGVIMR